MDAKTRRVLKSKQPQQEVLDTSIAAVANKSKAANVITPKVWVKDITMPANNGDAMAILPAFIHTDKIISMNVVLEIQSGSGAENVIIVQPPVDYSGATTTYFIALHKQSREIRTIFVGGVFWPGKSGKLTIFYI